jgi:hypothetical protein
VTKLALVWSAERAGREIDAIWEKRQAVERKRADYDDTLRARLIEAKANYDGPFKEFVEKHTHISLTTAKRTLRIADGRGEEVRQQERERQQRHRGRDNPPVTPSMPIKEAKGLKLAASQGATMTEPEVAGCLRLVELPEAEFEKHFEDTVAAKVAPLAPEPVEQFPVIDIDFATRRLTDVDQLFPGIEAYGSDPQFQFDDDKVDLELYDTLERVADKLKILADALGDVPVIMEARNKRAVAEAAERQVKAKAKVEAAEAARVARIKWEVDHGEEAREAYYAEALAKAKDHRYYETDEGDFDQAAFDAAYKPGEDGEVGHSNPEHEFFERWRKEHHAIWPGHLEAEPVHVDRVDDHKQRTRRNKQLKAAVNLDHITDMKKARKLYDAADYDHGFEAMCALADFIKVERPECASPSLECDHKVDPADVGHQDRFDAMDAWKQQNGTYLAATSVLSDKLWRHEEPTEAAAADREQAKEHAETKKRLIAEAKSPDKTKAKALKNAKRDAMDGDMDEAKEEARENEERWGDLKDQWIADWEADNWGDEQVAEVEKEFLDQWEFEHGQEFPASKY